MKNRIDQIAIGDILDGRYFYIPAYQRGYRWTEKQVGDLLRDLLCFANDDKKDDFSFYCLQPVIARPITDDKRIATIFGEEKVEDVRSHKAWEIIDGQQRLTTIYLIYRYLMEMKQVSPERLRIDEGKEEYHIFYATRPESSSFLKGISLSRQGTENDLDNIDFFHMSRAFSYIDKWIEKEGREINLRHHLGKSLDTVRGNLWTLLNGDADTKTGSVQVLWYELAEETSTPKDDDSTQSSIKEFQKINTGKIKLTDAELIKGLFLMEKNFKTGKVHLSELALEWELIENTLHDDSFWYFLQKKGVDMPNRIDFLFNLLYKITKLESVPEDEWKNLLEQLDLLIQDTSRSEIFRFYNDQFEGKNDEELNTAVTDAWKKVMTLFRTLDDWYYTPAIYNYIGLLSQCLKGVDVVPEQSQITTKYKSSEHNNLYNLLLTLNVHLINKQNSKFDSSSEIYKFPFDVLNSQKWDIEHVDSFHSNKLTKAPQQIEWIDTALADFKGLSDDERNEILVLKAITRMISRTA